MQTIPFSEAKTQVEAYQNAGAYATKANYYEAKDFSDYLNKEVADFLADAANRPPAGHDWVLAFHFQEVGGKLSFVLVPTLRDQNNGSLQDPFAGNGYFQNVDGADRPYLTGNMGNYWP